MAEGDVVRYQLRSEGKVLLTEEQTEFPRPHSKNLPTCQQSQIQQNLTHQPSSQSAIPLADHRTLALAPALPNRWELGLSVEQKYFLPQLQNCPAQAWQMVAAGGGVHYQLRNVGKALPTEEQTEFPRQRLNKQSTCLQLQIQQRRTRQRAIPSTIALADHTATPLIQWVPNRWELAHQPEPEYFLPQ